MRGILDESPRDCRIIGYAIGRWVLYLKNDGSSVFGVHHILKTTVIQYLWTLSLLGYLPEYRTLSGAVFIPNIHPAIFPGE